MTIKTSEEVEIAEDSDLMQGNRLMLSSLSANTEEERKALFNIANGETEKLSGRIGEEFNLKDVYVEEVMMKKTDGDGNTLYNLHDEPILYPAPRIILIDDKGVAVACVSTGVLSSLKKLFQFFGYPSYNKPIKIKFRQISIKEKRVLKFDVV